MKRLERPSLSVHGAAKSTATTSPITTRVACLACTPAIQGEALGRSLFEADLGAPVIAIVAGSVIAPLLLLCLAAGQMWATILRRYAAVSGPDPLPNTMMQGFGLSLLVFQCCMTTLGWVVFGSAFLMLGGDVGQFID